MLLLPPLSHPIALPDLLVVDSVFCGAFLNSLGIAHDPQTRDGWTLQAHIANVAREGKSSSGTETSDFQACTNLDVVTRFIDVLFTEFIDFSFSQANKSARRIITPTNPATAVAEEPTIAVSSQQTESALATLKAEEGLTFDDPPTPDDMRICSAFGALGHLEGTGRIYSDLYNRKVGDMLQALRWRMGIKNHSSISYLH